MDEPNLPIEELQEELNKALVELAKTKDLNKRVQLSELIKNLSSSLGVFFNFASDMMMHDLNYEDSDDFLDD